MGTEGSSSVRWRVGGHQPTNQGLEYAVLGARALNHDAMQIMLAGGREYDPREVSMETAEEFRKLTHGMDVFVHLPYVINPAESRHYRRRFYLSSVRKFKEVAGLLGAKGLVLHAGYKKESTRDEALGNVVKFVDGLLEGDGPEVYIEVDAGSKNGSAIGHPAFVSKALLMLDNENAGMCWDTTHLYARGIDLWNEGVRKEMIERYGHHVRLIHLNVPDLEVTLGGHLDRHNSPFSIRQWDHPPFLRDLLSRWVGILERRSLAVQEEDTEFIKKTEQMK